MEFTLTPEPTDAEKRVAHVLFSQPIDFLLGVVAMGGLPAPNRIEVCFAGRSNVGKSSLINAICGRNGLARTSNRPGRTQEINYFTLGEAHYLVDVPGYGFAKAPLAVVQKWQALLRAYLAGRANLRRVFLLVDARHGAKTVDKEMMEMLSRAAVTFQVVLTKADKMKEADLAGVIADTQKVLKQYPASFSEIIVSSSAKGLGIETIKHTIATLV